MQRSQMPTETDDWKKKSKSKKKTLYLEYRIKPEYYNGFWQTLLSHHKEWRKHHAKYRTEEQRKMAMDTMNRKDTLFEYRIPTKDDAA